VQQKNFRVGRQRVRHCRSRVAVRCSAWPP
jgi:hypothetical protein